MEYKELKLKNEVELKKILDEYHEKLRDLRFKIASKQVKNVREVRKVKKIIAQILTIFKIKKHENSTK